MKKIIFPTLTLFLLSCSNTPAAKWDSATAAKTCFDAATKGKYDLDAPQLKRIKGICDCVGQKMVTTFKTEKEANEKMLDAAAIANECKEEWQKMEIQNLGK
jgi:hypothetical protein